MTEIDQDASTTTHNQLSRLRQNLADHFSDEEVRNLCFDLDVDYESLPGQGKEGKARELVAFMRRTGRLPALIAECRRQRPSVSWEYTPESPAQPPVVPSSASTFSPQTPPDLQNTMTPPPQMGFQPVGRWQIRRADGAAQFIEFYPNGILSTWGVAFGVPFQGNGTWTFFIATQTLQFQGMTNTMMPFALVIVFQGEQQGIYFGLANDGWGYYFSRA
jgi:hypothetical protein